MSVNYDALGKEQERRIVRWARTNGFPAADRVVRTGAGKNYGHRPDEGDIWLTPGVIVQSKRLSPVARAERAVPVWMEQTEAQRAAAGADIALLVVRREGTTDVGRWWAWLPLAHLSGLMGGGSHLPETRQLVMTPVRLLVLDATALIRAAGYGEPLEVAA